MSKYNADSIMVLEGLEAVRRRPGMYIGSTGSRGLNHLIYEIVDNAVDEHLAGHCSEVTVTLERDGSAAVSDNGRGIPVDMHRKGISAERVIFTTLHAGGKFDQEVYKVSGGLHGVGSSVVNALSQWMKVCVHKDGKIYEDSYERGIPTTELKEGLLPVTGKTKTTGTRIQFLPDDQIFDHIRFKADAVRERLHETAFLNPGLTIHFENRRDEKEPEVFHEPEGLAGYIKKLNQGKETVTEVVYVRGREENVETELAFQFHEGFEELILGYCNSIHTIEGGTHLTGFKGRFTALMNAYAKELGILKDKDGNFTGPDTRCGMTAVVSVRHPDPMFEGQTKTKLGNADASRAVASVAGEELTLYFDKNLDTLKAILNKAETSAKIRKSEMKAKSNLLGKQKFSFDANGKLANCESRDASKNEIFIVEGNSAGGSAKSARDRKFQAILPIRGKILNVEKATMDKVLANAEIKSMIQAFGCGFSEGYGNDFDISKLKYDKIIVMTDADVDGAHISTLLLTFFYRFMPELIMQGHVYLATPPLYKAVPKKGPEEYLYDDEALNRYRKKHKNFILQRYKGLGEMDAEQLWESTLNPESRVLKRVEIDDMRRAAQVTEMLMGSEVSPRKRFIYDHAREAEIDA